MVSQEAVRVDIDMDPHRVRNGYTGKPVAEHILDGNAAISL